MARTITIKKGGGGIYSPGWHELTVSKAKYNDYQGTQCIDIWFEGYPDNFNARVTGSLEGPDKTMMIKIDDSAEALTGCKLNGYFYKDGEYSRCLKQFAPTVFKNEVEAFSENDVVYWKSKAEKYYEEYVKKNTDTSTFVSPTESDTSTGVTAEDVPF